MRQIIMIGEGMVELSRGPGDAANWRVGYGGDTLNSAVHLARFGRAVGFLTALGDDPFSADLRSAWLAEGLDPAMLLQHPGGHPGLYAITTDDAGERTFSYWRADSAARQLFRAPGIAAAVAAAARADLLMFSLISLAILPPGGRDALLDLARRVRDVGGIVAFDGNFRARLWRDTSQARAMRDRAIACCTIGLPTLEDEVAIDGPATASEIAARWRRGGAREVVVKLGADGCLVPDGRRVAPPSRLRPVDTSGAGDAFNAGYLHARLGGQSPEAAAAIGHRLAGWVIMRSGAVPPIDADAPYLG